MSSPNTIVFDREQSQSITLTRAGAPFLTVHLRYPTDEELTRRERRIKTFQRKGNTVMENEGLEEAELEMITAVQVEGDAVGEDMACRLANVLLQMEIPEPPTITPEGYSTGLKLRTGITVHVLREPSQRELRKYREGAIWIGPLRYGKQEVKTLLSAVGEFYDKLLIRVEGYPGGKETVPIIQKSAVLSAVLAQMAEDNKSEEDDPENFHGASALKIPALASSSTTS